MINILKPRWMPWSLKTIKSNLKIFKRYVKWGKQRLSQGYCDGDVWDLDDFLADILVKTLRQLASRSKSYPGTEEFPNIYSWAVYLNDTADMIEYGAKTPDEVEENPFPIGSIEYKEQYQKILNQQRDCLEQGFERLAHVFHTLWD